MVCIYKNAFITYWDVIPQTMQLIGSAALVVLATAGSTNSVRTINAHLLTYGEQPSAWSYWSDATVLDDYAMTTTTSHMQLPVLCKFALSLPCIPLCPYPLDETLQFSSCMHRIG